MFQIIESPHSNSLLNQLIISHSDTNFKAIIYPNLGASLQQLSFGKTALIDGLSQDVEGLNSYKGTYSSSFLFPFPNRIAKGKYTFEDANYQLSCNENGRENAIHGCLDHAAFTVQSQECTKAYVEVLLKYKHTVKVTGFPFTFDCLVRYRFSTSSVFISLTVNNTGLASFPYGFGWHPYFLMDSFNDTVLSFDGEDQVDCDAAMIPVGRSKHGLPNAFKLENHQFDTGFIQHTSASSLETNSYKVSFSTSDNLESYLQVYTPPHGKSIALEPMTCIADSFNNKTGLRVLQANEAVTWDIKMDIHIK